MKNQIKLTALFLLLFSGAFASVPKVDKDAAPAKSIVSIIGLHTKIGVKVIVQENAGPKALVTISNTTNDVLYKGFLGGDKGSSRVYNLSELPDGDYNVTVSQNHQDVNKQIHIYDDNGKKDYFIMQ